MVQCQICKLQYKQLQSHIKKHNISTKEYKQNFPGSEIWSAEQKDKLIARMKNGQSKIMSQKSIGCKKPRLSITMSGNQRGKGTDRSKEKQRYIEQAKKQHKENNFGKWDEERKKHQARITKHRWETGQLKPTWKPKWEKELGEYLANKNINFITDFIIPADRQQNGYRLAKPFDFYLPNHNLLIELQGCFWHGCRECYKPHHIQERVMRNDAEKEKIANQCNFRLLKIWEHEKEKLYDKVTVGVFE
jgi:hypothetical protein